MIPTSLVSRLRRLVLFVPIFAILFNISVAPYASAINKFSEAPNIGEQALSYAYYKALLQCYSKDSGAKVHTGKDKLAQNSLFSTAGFGYSLLSYFTLKNAGLSLTDNGCDTGSSNLSPGKDALAFWGVSAIEMVCSPDFSYNGNAIYTKKTDSGAPLDCQQDKEHDFTVDRDNAAAGFQNWAQKRLGIDKYSTFTWEEIRDKLLYAALYQTFIGVCTQGNAVTSPSGTYYPIKNLAGVTENYLPNDILNNVVDNGSNQTVKRGSKLLGGLQFPEYGDSNTMIDGSSFYNAFDGYGTNETKLKNYASFLWDCSKVSTGLGNLATTIATGYCNKLGLVNSTDANESTACVNGWLHAQETNYCAMKYHGPITQSVPDAAGAAAGATTTTPGSTLQKDKLEYQACNQGASAILGDTTLVTDATAADAAGYSSCPVDGIGWIICPIMTAVSKMNDKMYSVVEDTLKLNPLTMYDDNKAITPTYQIWQSFRDIANVLLVVAFLIIIFSQITSIGIDNYGIKKLLPRIILSAIAINLSYFVIMLGVDLVNVIGSSLHDLVNGFVNQAWGGGRIDFSWSGLLTVLGVGVAITATAIVSGGLQGLVLMCLPFLITGAFALLAAFFTLAVRNALVIVLAIASPLAFAAFLLPNTKSLFDKWRKLIMGMLLMYPMAAILFSGAKLAGAMIISLGGGINHLFGLFICAAPLFMLPWLAKSSGGILAKIGGGLDKLAKTGGQAIKKNAFDDMTEKQKQKYRANQTGLGGFGTRDRTMPNPERESLQNELNAGRNTGAGESLRAWRRREGDLNRRLARTPERVPQTGARRTWGSQLENMSRSTKAETEEYKGTQQENWRSDGTYGAPAGSGAFTRRQAGRASRVMAAQETLELRKGATDARRKDIVSQSINQAGSINQQYDTAKRDSTTLSEGAEARTVTQHKQRVQAGAGPNATEQERHLYEASQEKTLAEGQGEQSDTELKLSHLSDAGDMGAATRAAMAAKHVAGAQVERAELDVKTVAEGQNAGVFVDLSTSKKAKKIADDRTTSIVESAQTTQGRRAAIRAIAGANPDPAARAAAEATADRLQGLALEEKILSGSTAEAQRARARELVDTIVGPEGQGLPDAAVAAMETFDDMSAADQAAILAPLTPEQRVAFDAQRRMSGAWGEGGRTRTLGRAFADRSEAYKETVARQKTVDSNLGVHIGHGRRAPTPPNGSDHIERIKTFAREGAASGISPEEVSASMSALETLGGMGDIRELARVIPMLPDADLREEAQAIAARKFSRTEGPATGGGQIARMGIPHGQPGSYDEDTAYVEYAAGNDDFTAAEFMGTHEVQRNGMLDALARASINHPGDENTQNARAKLTAAVEAIDNDPTGSLKSKAGLNPDGTVVPGSLYERMQQVLGNPGSYTFINGDAQNGPDPIAARTGPRYTGP